jgi:HAE1 family hydrophobic/amphiphilic exporter-1
VAPKKVRSVGLEEVARLAPGTAPSSVNRIARQRQVTLTANLKPGGSQAAVIQELNAASKQLGMEPGYGSGLAGSSKELGRTGYYFALAFSLTFIFMYIVLAAQFESFVDPITILITLPLAMPFGILAPAHRQPDGEHLLRPGPAPPLRHRQKENAILQIDHTNGLRTAGGTAMTPLFSQSRPSGPS